jgi:hypothetical protein
MHLVAVDALATDVDEETPLLARDLGIAPYDARALLVGERPTVVLRTDDEPRASALVTKLLQRRHRAVACDTRTILPTDAMVQLAGFTLGDVALTSERGEELPYADLLAVLRAVRLDPHGRAASVPRRRPASLPTLEVPVRRFPDDEDREQLLYLVRRSRGSAWVVRGRATSFSGLGARLAPSRTENFLRLVAALRERAPDAAYDDRLMRFRTLSHERFDERVHLLALTFAGVVKGPYR